jgi:hypothetical protein
MSNILLVHYVTQGVNTEVKVSFWKLLLVTGAVARAAHLCLFPPARAMGAATRASRLLRPA